MSDIHKFSVKEAANVEAARGWQVRNVVNLASAAHQARVIPASCHAIELYSTVDFYIHFDVSETVKTISSVANNGSTQLQLNSTVHGLANANIVCLAGFEYNALHVMGAVANKTANDFDITTIAWSASYAGQSGYAFLTSDTIDSTNHLYYPADTLINFKIPWGMMPILTSNDKTDEHRLGEFAAYEKALIMHVKAADSLGTATLRYREG